MRLRYAVLFVAAMRASSAAAFSYFESEIDYWQSKPAEPPPAESKAAADKPAREAPVPPAAPPAPEPFDWKKHTDPKNDEFFREGDYIPPAPFLELVRNPSDTNIKHWFEYIGKRNELNRRLNERMREYVAQRGAGIDDRARAIVQTQATAEANASPPPDHTRYRFRLYFHSTCPHCKHMMQTMSELQSRGYFVEVVQIDDDRRAAQGLPFPVRNAEPGELESKGIKSWPVLLVGDLQKKVLYRINGYQTTANVLNSISRRS